MTLMVASGKAIVGGVDACKILTMCVVSWCTTRGDFVEKPVGDVGLIDSLIYGFKMMESIQIHLKLKSIFKHITLEVKTTELLDSRKALSSALVWCLVNLPLYGSSHPLSVKASSVQGYGYPYIITVPL
ncbi:hypothetical protein Plhal304r1_c036g0110961 [Plasmopara halstedii]